MFEELRNLLMEEYSVDCKDPSNKFKTDLGLNSFQLMNLICLIEEKYDIELDEEKYRTMTTVQEICDYVAQLRGM